MQNNYWLSGDANVHTSTWCHIIYRMAKSDDGCHEIVQPIFGLDLPTSINPRNKIPHSLAHRPTQSAILHGVCLPKVSWIILNWQLNLSLAHTMEIQESQLCGTDLVKTIMKFPRIKKGPWVEHGCPYIINNHMFCDSFDLTNSDSCYYPER